LISEVNREGVRLSKKLVAIEPSVLDGIPSLVGLLGTREVKAQVDAWNQVILRAPATFSRPLHLLHAISETLQQKPQLPLLTLLSEATISGRNRSAAAAELKGLDHCAIQLKAGGLKLRALKDKLWNPTQWEEATAELLVSGLFAEQARSISLDNPTGSGTKENYDLLADTEQLGAIHTEIKVGHEMIDHTRPAEIPLLAEFQDLLRQELLPLGKGVGIRIHRQPFNENEVIDAVGAIVSGIQKADKLQGSASRDFWTEAFALMGPGVVSVMDRKAEKEVLYDSLWELMRKACRQVPARVPRGDLRAITIVSQYNYEVIYLRRLLFSAEGLWTNRATRDLSSHIDGVIFVSRHGSRSSELNPFSTYSVDAEALPNPTVSDDFRDTRLVNLAIRLIREWED
jgi:hypothetical protein